MTICPAKIIETTFPTYVELKRFREEAVKSNYSNCLVIQLIKIVKQHTTLDLVAWCPGIAVLFCYFCLLDALT